MIKLTQNETSTVVLTLTESQTLASPYYLFELTNDATQKQELFNAVDTSTATTRYNMFSITLSGSSSEDVNAGVINVPYNLNGYWTYKVYEATTQTLVVSATISLLEVGKCLINGSGDTIVTKYEYTSTNQNGSNTYVYS